jgi:hypothetical protein
MKCVAARRALTASGVHHTRHDRLRLAVKPQRERDRWSPGAACAGTRIVRAEKRKGGNAYKREGGNVQRRKGTLTSMRLEGNQFLIKAAIAQKRRPDKTPKQTQSGPCVLDEGTGSSVPYVSPN